MPMQKASRHRLTVLTRAHFGLLLAVLTAWHLWLWPVSPLTSHRLIILGLHILPLLAFLPGLWRQKPRVHIWLCYFLLLYFCQGVINAFALPHIVGMLGLLEALLTAGLFTSAMYAARHLKTMQAH